VLERLRRGFPVGIWLTWPCGGALIGGKIVFIEDRTDGGEDKI
jgi:hypothetical protein